MNKIKKNYINNDWGLGIEITLIYPLNHWLLG